ncbi:MAG: hypothetical protein KJP15_11110, partial [Gammaproteobacteria bacterium]|nr:hypothetical protein [Gammaproteobacteria bacterium]
MNKIQWKYQQARSQYNKHLWLGRLLLVFLILLLVLSIVRVSLPYTIVYSAVYWLDQLVLLKDKKNRIKLDIPVTGDINDPNFNPTDAI